MKTEIFTTKDEERLDKFVAKQLPDLSRSFVQKLIADGQVTVNDVTIIKNNYRLQPCQEIKIILPDLSPANIRAENLPLDILYEDDDIIIINKARGMVVHPAAGVTEGTLVNALLFHAKNLSGINGELRPGIVHRLDKDTSGVMVAAKNDRAHRSLAAQIATKEAARVYLAIVRGNISENAGIISAPIGRSPKDRQKMAVVTEGGKEAVTEFSVKERFGNYTLIECRLRTGRTHQIRVHLTYIGHPLLGDPKYGATKNEFAIEGQALHSTDLTLTHPTTGQIMNFTAPLPADMSDILTYLRKGISK